MVGGERLHHVTNTCCRTNWTHKNVVVYTDIRGRNPAAAAGNQFGERTPFSHPLEHYKLPLLGKQKRVKRGIEGANQ